MSYVKASNAARNPVSGKTHSPAAHSAPKAEASSNKVLPTHNLAIRCGDGDNSTFVELTGLFGGETKDGRALLKGTSKMQVIIRMEDGTELIGSQFFVTAKNK
jgi:hypothetical protein